MTLYLGMILIFVSVMMLSQNSFSSSSRLAQTYRKEVLSEIEKGLSESFLFLDMQKAFWPIFIILMVAGTISILMHSVVPFALATTIVGIGPKLLLLKLQQTRKKKFLVQFQRCLPQVTSMLKAGHSLERAFESLASHQPSPLAQEIQLMFKEIQLGKSLDEVLQKLRLRFPSTELDIVTRAISMSRRTGSNLGEAFEKVSDMLERRTKLQNKLRALTAQGKFQAYSAIALPFLISIVLEFLAPGHISPLLEGVGKSILIGTLAWMAIGSYFIFKITRQELFK